MRVTLFGDSVFAGHGLAPRDGPAARLADRLPPPVIVDAAGVADETAADGLARSGQVIGEVVFVEFGLNDAIRGIAPCDAAAALGAIVDDLSRHGARVVLVAALVPAASIWPSLSDQAGLAQQVAADHGAVLCPDILAYRRECPAAVQHDGLHPDRTGARMIAERLATFVDRPRG